MDSINEDEQALNIFKQLYNSSWTSNTWAERRATGAAPLQGNRPAAARSAGRCAALA